LLKTDQKSRCFHHPIANLSAATALGAEPEVLMLGGQLLPIFGTETFEARSQTRTIFWGFVLRRLPAPYLVFEN
jgi:hypothetical protein